MTLRDCFTRTWGGDTKAHRPVEGGRVVAYKGAENPPLVHLKDGTFRFAKEDEYRGHDDWAPGFGG